MPKNAVARSLSMRASGDGVRYSRYPEGTAQYTPSAPPVGDSALKTFAAAMSPNTYADFSMGNLTNAIFVAASSSGTLAFLNGNSPRMTWDPVHKKINMAGCAHTGSGILANSGGLATYDAPNDAWTRETYDWASDGKTGHPYYHNAVNTNTGDLFIRAYNSRTVYRRVYGDTGETSWASFSTINAPNYANQVAGALEYYPDLNSGAGGLFFCDELGGHYSNAAMSSWSDVSGASQTGIGTIHNFSAYANGLVYYGGGNSSQKMWSMDASGVATARADTPVVCGAGNSFGPPGHALLFPHPNGVDLLAFDSRTGGNLYKYTAGSNTWSTVGAHDIGVSDGIWAGVTIQEYGAFVAIKFTGASGTPTCKVYRPA